MSEELEHIELRNEELDAVLGQAPSNVVRWGITVIAGFVLILFIGSVFFKYPDIVETQVEVTTQNPPTNIIARVDGKITHLFVKDRELVKPNTVLATLESPTDYSQVVILKELLEKLRPAIQEQKTVRSFGITLMPLNRLGEIQATFTNFTRSMADLMRFYQVNIYPQKIAAVNRQIAMTKVYNSKLRSQSKLVEQELSLSKLQHIRDSLLYRSKIIAQSDMENSTSSQIQKRYSFEGSQLTLADSQIKLALLEQQLLDLQLQAQEEEKKLFLSVDESYRNLLSEIAVWEQRYVLRTPIEGRVSYSKFWSTNQNVSASEVVLTVIPEKKSQVIGKINLQMAGAGKVKVGQKVNIRFDNYPYMEYGTVLAQISNISQTATANNTYPVELVLPYGLKTNYNTQLPYSNGMRGQAEIVTDDLTLFLRFFNPVKALFKKHLNVESLPEQPVVVKQDTVEAPPSHRIVIKHFNEK